MSNVSPNDFRAGQRVQAHPGTDVWARGVRFGTVEKIGRKLVHVKMDNGWLIRFDPDNIIVI